MKREGENVGLFNNKRGQITIFIIIAVVIVAIGILVYVFYPKISSTLGGGEQDANAFIQTCMIDEIKNNVELVSLQGGSLDPELYVLNDDEKISYLCYTENYYKTCVVQQPLLKNHIENEIEQGIKDEVKNCFDELKSSFESRGYDITVSGGDIKVDLRPERIFSTFNYLVTLTKTETQKYESFNVTLNNNLYQLVEIANSIIDWESTYGDAETTLYMDIYHDIKIEKLNPASEYGARVYVLTNRDTGDKFQFASRSVVYPAGYGLNSIK